MRRGDGAALLGFGSVGFEIQLLRVSGLTVRKIAFQMLIFTAVGLQIRPSGLILVHRTAVVGHSTCDGLATGADATTVIKTASFSSIGTLFGCQRSAG